MFIDFGGIDKKNRMTISNIFMFMVFKKRDNMKYDANGRDDQLKDIT